MGPRLCGVVASLILSIGAASAADLPSRRSPPVFLPPPIPVFTWTGLYVGATAGAVSQDARPTTAIAPGSHLVLPPNLATVSAAGAAGGSRVGFTGGGTVGYNHQINAVVIGIEGDGAYTGGDPRGLGTGPLIGAGQPNVTVRTSGQANFLATGRARLGYAVDRALFYATGGVALTDLRVSQTYNDTLFGTTGGLSTSKLRVGFAVGGGIEYCFANNWSVKAEYLFAKFDGTAGSYIITSRTGGTNAITVGDRQELQLGRIGINYRFDLSAPVVARY